MKSPVITILFLLISISLLGQIKDTREKLNIQGEVKDFSVSPDGKIFLKTTMANIYYTNSIDSGWHCKELVFQSSDEYSLPFPDLIRISFFNKDTAIITGYIPSKDGNGLQNGFYRTTNSGETWDLFNSKWNDRIYTVCVDMNGNAWIAGDSKNIYHSDDFGMSWKQRKLHPESVLSGKVYSIYMENAKTGMLGMNYNKILKTNNNWKTTKSIKTPHDQLSNKEEKKHFHSEVSKINKWGTYIIAKQMEYVCYSDEKKISWKFFPIKIIDFDVDKTTNRLYGITDSLDVVLFYSPQQYDIISAKRLKSYPEDMEIVDGSLYILTKTNEIYKINSNEHIHHIPYNYNMKISKPDIVRQCQNLTWGITKDHIYISENNPDGWHRTDILDFEVADFLLLNDSLAVLWDGAKNNYLYSLANKTIECYFLDNPIETFLKYPLKSFSINVKDWGSLSRDKNIVYEWQNDSILKISDYLTDSYSKRQVYKLQQEIKRYDFFAVLSSVNSNPKYIPSLREFSINDDDKRNYLLMVDNLFPDNQSGYKKNQQRAKEFYYTVVQMLDTLENNIIKSVFDQNEEFTTQMKSWFSVQVVNGNNDTLNVERTYFREPFSWNLPWVFEYKGNYFNSYNIDFSRFIASCLPDDFTNKKIFDNQYLIMNIANYLYRSCQKLR